ncbi:MAG: winged helix-turn-helix transcriptional regulator [Phycisphaerae bacterium]|nr:winged helix-turn-helix transcriptional regulator [Phycisphaerae bacterium]
MGTPLSMEDQIVAAIRRIMRAVDLHSRRLAEEHGLTGPQLATLKAAARLGEASTGALARAVHLSGPTVTGILDRLAKRGLVGRARNGQDRRGVTVRLTSSGEDVLAAAPSLLQDRFRQELVKLEDWEQTMLLAMLQRIAAMMDAESIDASPVLVPGPVNAVTQGAAPLTSPAEPVAEFGDPEAIPAEAPTAP